MTGPPPDPSGVYISTAQMYQEMRSLHDTMGRVESKLDGLRRDNAGIRADLADHETRLRSLERSRWPLPSIAALVAVVGLIITLWQLAR